MVSAVVCDESQRSPQDTNIQAVVPSPGATSGTQSPSVGAGDQYVVHPPEPTSSPQSAAHETGDPENQQTPPDIEDRVPSGKTF